MTPAERELETLLLQRYELWKQTGYVARRFKRMLTPGDATYKGPVETVRHLLRKKPGKASGFARLCAAGRLDWTVEALFEKPADWQRLFTEADVETARQRYLSARQG
jgi:hypothetical protein